jgi:ATP-dependent Clp protease ATP-binding subunit ClpA
MQRSFSPATLAAVELAKAALPADAVLDVHTLMAALYQTDEGLQRRFPSFAHILAPLPRLRDVAGSMKLADEVRGIVNHLLGAPGPAVEPEEFFSALLVSDTGRTVVAGIPPADRDKLVPPPGTGTANADGGVPVQGLWRQSEARRAAATALAPFGRLLTDPALAPRPFVEREGEMGALVRTLCKPRRRSAIVVGESGSGKTALVYALARRIVSDGDSLPLRVRDLDIFELSPTFLKSGASMVGQYEERLRAVVEVLKRHPAIVLFIDEIHSFLQSSVHFRGPHSEANESLKAELGRGEIACIGCTTLAEYRHFIEPDAALARRFKVIRLEPPSRAATVGVLRGRRPALEAHFAVSIPSDLVERVIDLTERYLPSQSQPDKSIQILEDGCAFACTKLPPAQVLDEAALMMAIEDIIGHSAVRSGSLTEDAVFERLHARFVGQDDVLRTIARAFVAGLGELISHKGPRGVFFFAGPTGVGKTEVAVELAGLLGDRRPLIQVNCNALGGHSLDGGPVVSALFGAAPGYVGYARGQGGLLSRIRDLPETVVLFDEIDKAPERLFEILLQIIDKGVVNDLEGKLLDFSRSFIVFTSNVGWRIEKTRTVGFAQDAKVDEAEAGEALARTALVQSGVSPEFLARIRQFFVFRTLTRQDTTTVVERQLERLRQLIGQRGFAFEWTQNLIPHLVAQWSPRFGVRHVKQITENRVVEQLGVAEAQGELAGVKTIRLELLENLNGSPPGAEIRVQRERRESVLVVRMA